MSGEPVALFGAVKVLLQSILVAIVLFGVKLSPEQSMAVLGIGLALIELVRTIITRGKVTPV